MCTPYERRYLASFVFNGFCKVSHISDKFLFLEFVVLILLSLFHIFFVEYRSVALSQVLNRHFTIGFKSVSYLKEQPLFTSEQQKFTVSFHMLFDCVRVK